MANPPPRAVLDAFGVATEPAPLAGGRGTSWRAGPVVLKPIDMTVEELEWQARVLAAIDGADDVRVAPPVRSRAGSLAVDGWTASRFQAGSPPTADQYADVAAAGRAFHRHLHACPRPGFLDRREHPWARADRVAWEEEDPDDDDGARLPHIEALLDVRRPVSDGAQLVHGDLTDNVHLDPDLPPLVLDFSPYWRPPSYATAIVVADAVVFRGARLDLIDDIGADEDATFPQMLVRALLFRAVADHLVAPHETWARWFGQAVRTVVQLTDSRR